MHDRNFRVEIGPITSWTLAMFVAVGSGGFWNMIEVVAYYGVRMSIEDSFDLVIPGHAVTVPPAMIILSFLLEGALFGVIGLLIAVPAAAIIRILLDSWGELREFRNVIASLSSLQKLPAVILRADENGQHVSTPKGESESQLMSDKVLL